MLCIITRKSRASIRGKLHHCQTYMRHFSHRRNYTACSSRDSFAYSENRHDSYPQFPRSSLGTRGLQTRSHRQKKKTTAFLESCFAQASSTNKSINHCKKSLGCSNWFRTDRKGRGSTGMACKIFDRSKLVPCKNSLGESVKICWDRTKQDWYYLLTSTGQESKNQSS